MFTGYIDHFGKILSIEASAEDQLSLAKAAPTNHSTHAGKRFLIHCNYPDLTKGESIAISGICLTVTDCSAGQFYCDLSPETLSVSTANTLKIGGLVNLERPLTLNDRLQGHIVLGHVDQVCRVTAQKKFANYLEYHFTGVSTDNRSLIVKKGSIAINGVSLTLNEIFEDGFSVMLIPETLRKTNLGALQLGDDVNIEYDYFAKLIMHGNHREYIK